jgi:hypothetical protein
MRWTTQIRMKRAKSTSTIKTGNEVISAAN